jgi:hypothetical protein
VIAQQRALEQRQRQLHLELRRSNLDRDAEGPARPWVRRQLQAVGSPAPVVAPEADVPPAAAAAG